MLDINFRWLSIISLRGISVLLKFSLFVLLGKSLSIEDYGVLMLILSISTFSTHILGFDIYMYANREIVNKNFKEQLSIIITQFKIYIIIYLVIIPLILYISINFYIDIDYWYILVGLLLTEHIGQEIYRILNILQKPLSANILNFIRTGFFPLVVLLSFFVKASFSLQIILNGFIFFNLIAITFGIVYLKRHFKVYNYVHIPILTFIKGGGIVLVVFFIGSLCQKFIEYGNRFYIDYAYGVKYVGIFSFFFQISSILNIIVDSGIIIIIYPYLIKLYERNLIHEIRKIYKTSVIKLFIIALILFIFCFFFLENTLLIYSRKDFTENTNTFFFLLIGNLFWNLSYINQTLIYASKNEKFNLLFLGIIGFLNIPTMHFFSTTFNFIGISISYLFLGLSIAFATFFQLFKLKLL